MICANFMGMKKNELRNVSVTRVYVPRFFVSSQQRFGATDIKALTALGVWTNRVIALRQISVTALFYLEDSRRIHPQSLRACQPKDLKRRQWRNVLGREREKVREGERERAHACGRERERQRVRKRFGSSFYVFSSTWACPMQIRLSQECYLLCLVLTLVLRPSFDIPCLLAITILESFSLFYLPK